MYFILKGKGDQDPAEQKGECQFEQGPRVAMSLRNTLSLHFSKPLRGWGSLALVVLAIAWHDIQQLPHSLQQEYSSRMGAAFQAVGQLFWQPPSSVWLVWQTWGMPGSAELSRVSLLELTTLCTMLPMGSEKHTQRRLSRIFRVSLVVAGDIYVFKSSAFWFIFLRYLSSFKIIFLK